MIDSLPLTKEQRAQEHAERITRRAADLFQLRAVGVSVSVGSHRSGQMWRFGDFTFWPATGTWFNRRTKANGRLHDDVPVAWLLGKGSA